MKQLIKLFFLLAFAVVTAYATSTPLNAPDLDSSYDTGVSNTDNLTNNSTLYFTGDKGYYETIRVYRDNTDTGYTDSSLGYTYLIFVYSNPEGSYGYSVTADDGSGESQHSPALNITLDTTAPNVTLNLLDSSNSGSLTDLITNVTTPNFEISVDEQSDVYIDNVFQGNTQGTWTFSDTYTGSDYGSYYSKSAYAVDVAGNYGYSTTLNLTIDTGAFVNITQLYPYVSTYESTTYQDDGYYVSLDTDVATSVTRTLTIDGTALSFNMVDSNTAFIPNTSLTSLTEGLTYTLRVASLTDAAGNVTPEATQNFIYDKTGDTNRDAKTITIGVDNIENIYSTLDKDYFVFEMPSKGILSVSTNNADAHVELLTLNDINITAQNTSTINKLIDTGSYILRVSTDLNTTGNYTLSTSIVEYDDEIDASSLPLSKNQTFLVSESSEKMHVEAGILYMSDGSKYRTVDGSVIYNMYDSYVDNKFVVKGSNLINAGNTNLYIQNVLNDAFISIDTTNFNATQSVSVVDDAAYVLLGDDTIDVMDISDIKSNIFNTFNIVLPASTNGFDEILVHKDGTSTYAYIKDFNRALFVFDITNGANPVLTTYFDAIYMSDFTIDNNLLYVSSDSGVYIFDINDDPSKPKYLSKTTNGATGIDVYNGKLYANEYGNIYTYEISHDYEDSITDVKTVNKMNLNSTATINKYSGKNDVDIFRFDLENSGALSLTSANVDASDLTITVSQDFTFATTEVNATNFINQTVNLANLQAKTYYVRIETTDTDSFDEYTITNTFTTTTVTDAKDALLNLKISSGDSIALNTLVSSSLDNNNNDIDLFKLELPASGEISFTNPNGKTIGLYKADVNVSSSYADLTDVNTSNPVNAGTYYVKVSGLDSAYTFTPNFTSYGDTDEHQLSVSVSNVAPYDYVDPATISMDMSKGFINTPTYNNVKYLNVGLYQAIKNKTYISQVNDDNYIYALYRYESNVNTADSELGIDVFEYINNSNVAYRSNASLSSIVNGDTFAYKLKFVGAKLMFRDASDWFELSVSDIENITKSATPYLASTYSDVELSDSKVYAVDDTKIDIFNESDLSTVILSKSFNDVTSLEILDSIVYVATSTNGIKALNKNDLSLIKEITNIQNTLVLDSKGDTLYALENIDIFAANTSLKTLSLEKDFGDDFANATLISRDTNISGLINSNTDHDFFKVDIEFTGTINTVINAGVSCKMYSAKDLSIEVGANCDTGVTNVAAGRYYLDVNGTTSSYTINVGDVQLASDIQDTLKFYDGDNINITDQNTTFTSTIDVVGDVDYHKVTLDTTGLLSLDGNSTLVYENGYEVEKDGTNYNITVPGEYFIKVIGPNGDNYNVNSSFETIVDNKFIDNTSSENTLISSLELSGDNSKIISSGNILYLVDEIDGLSVIDITNINKPKILSRVNLQGTPSKLYLDGSILYVALGSDGFAVVDVSNSSSASLYSQTAVDDLAVHSITALGNKVYLGCEYTIKKYDLSKPTKPVLELSELYSSADDILIYGDKLLVTAVASLSVVDENISNVGYPSIAMSDPDKIVMDEDYIFALDDNNTINIINSDMTDTGKTISIEGTVKDLYINNKVLYVSKAEGYEIIEYKDIDNLVPSIVGVPVNSITYASNSLIIAEAGRLKILEATSDYSDTLISQNITSIDLSQTTKTTGQFSKDSDIDSFKYINVNYTGTFELNVTTEISDVNISLYNSNGADKVLLGSAINSLKTVINSGDAYLQIRAVNSVEQFSYEFSHTFVNDGTLDIIDSSYSYEEIYENGNLSNDLYKNGKDKDYYKLLINERGNLSFTSDNSDVKISLLYGSGTIIASNYDDENGSIKNTFDANLAEGEYFVLVENADETNLNSIDYSIDTTLGTTDEILMDSGVNIERLNTVTAFSHVPRFSYMLSQGTLSRMSNVLEKVKDYYIPEYDLDETGIDFNMFSYSTGDEEIIYISKIDYNDNTLNSIKTYHYNVANNEFTDGYSFDMSGIADEKILLIDKQDYVYYYDDDSLYISQSTNTELAQQLALDNLESVNVNGDYMYLVTTDFIKIVDISDKASIGIANILSEISVPGVKSIYVDDAQNRVFIGANNKIEIWNISDKTTPTQLSEFDIGFNDNDLWYEGTPSSLYMLDDKLYAAVESVGILMLNVDSFNTLSIFEKVLNLGEYFTDIYTFNGGAINYIVGETPESYDTSSYDIKAGELKVYFYENELLNADGSGTTNIISANSVQEGSATFEGCFIATAAYGSYFDVNVKVLRDFRDDYLMQNELGRMFVDYYYSKSPAIAASIVDNEAAKMFVRVTLTPVVYIIKYPAILAVLMLMLLFLAFRKTKIKSTKKLGNI